MARRKAWLTPDDTSPILWSGRCLNIPLPLYPSVVGALSLLTEAWRWEQFGSMTPDDAAQLATVMLDGFANEGCSDMDCAGVIQCLLDSGLLSGNTPDGDLRVLDGVPQVSYDGGLNWQDIAGDASAEPFVPASVPTSGATDDARKCLAATRAALVLNEVYKGVYGAVTADIYNAANTFSNWLGNAMNDILIFIYGEAAGVLNSEILRGYSLPTNYAAGELTQAQIDDLTCFLFNYATDADGFVTFDWGAIRDNMVSEMGINPGTALWSIVVYLKNRGLERASQVAITNVGNCVDCVAPCAPGGATTFEDFLYDSPYISPQYVQPLASCSGSVQGTWSSPGTITLTMPVARCVYRVDVVTRYVPATTNQRVTQATLSLAGSVVTPVFGGLGGGSQCLTFAMHDDVNNPVRTDTVSINMLNGLLARFRAIRVYYYVE